LPLEASGNIDEKTIVAVAETGVNCISTGAITKNIQAIEPLRVVTGHYSAHSTHLKTHLQQLGEHQLSYLGSALKFCKIAQGAILSVVQKQQHQILPIKWVYLVLIETRH
jgi:hypothetical protein